MKIRVIMLLIVSMLLFVAAHFILVIFESPTYTMGVSEIPSFYFGFSVKSFFVDLILYAAVGLQLFSIYMLIKEVRK